MEVQKQSYTASLNWVINQRCNLDCEYCFYNPTKKTEPIHKKEIEPILNSLERTGHTFKIVIAGGGEPFLVSNINEICSELTKQHYIYVVSNLTVTPKLKKFSEEIPPNKVVGITASLHVKELEKRGLTEVYIKNFKMLKEKGFKIVSRVVAYPDLAKKANDIIHSFHSKDIDLRFVPYIGTYDQKKYPESYTDSELRSFGLDRDEVSRRSETTKKCNAGYNSAVINKDGSVQTCFSLSENLGNIYEGFKFKDKMVECPFNKCICPLFKDHKELYEKALRENEKTRRPNTILSIKRKVKDKVRLLVSNT